MNGDDRMKADIQFLKDMGAEDTTELIEDFRRGVADDRVIDFLLQLPKLIADAEKTATEEIWVIVSQKGTVRRAYGWFDSFEACEEKCKEIRRLRACPDIYYNATCLINKKGLGKN